MKTKTRLYRVWQEMKNRCNNPNSKCYKNYGQKNIKVCEEWENNYSTFYKWAMENGYDEKAKRGVYTLDRINVNGNYEPKNCRFLTIREQQNNRTNNRILTYKGETHNITEWSNITGINRGTLFSRINKGLTAEQVLSNRSLKFKKELALSGKRN